MTLNGSSLKKDDEPKTKSLYSATVKSIPWAGIVFDNIKIEYVFMKKKKCFVDYPFHIHESR